MISHLPIDETMRVLAAAIFGLALGLLYFAALRRSIDLFVAGAGWVGPVVLTAGRLTAAALAFAGLVRLGPAATLAAFLAFLLARGIAVRTARKEG